MSASSSIDASEKLLRSPKKNKSKKIQSWSLKRRLFAGAGIAFVIVLALSVGLGVGLSQNGSDDDDSSDGGDSDSSPDNNNSTTIDPSLNSTDTNTTMLWQPVVGITWQYVLKSPLNSTLPNNTQVWDIDLFDNNKTTIAGLQKNNAKVICYFSAGTYESWRPDRAKFHPDDLGNNLDDWPGERWLNVSSPTVRSVMISRLDLAKQKGCNGVDPDNIDGYDNDNGLDLTQAQAIDYVKWLAAQAHARNMSIGLKNGGAIIPNVLSYMQWSVNEQCVQYDECDTYAAFTQANKPVFHVEYPKGDDTNNNNNVDSATKNKMCNNADASKFSTIIKNMDLDLWEQKC